MSDHATAPKPLLLASASPRRRELLAAMGLEFEVMPSAVDESAISADHPRTFALRAAFAKARDVAARLEPDRWVLAADTVVTRQMVLFGKPADAADARRMLRALSGETHEVITALALARSGAQETHLHATHTMVQFRPLTETEIDAYIATGEPTDKAGAYGIQGQGGDLIESIRGDYYNVVGLPCGALADMLQDNGLPGATIIPQAPLRWRQ